MLTKGGGSVSPPKIQDNSKNNKVELNSGSNQIEFTTNNNLNGILDTDGNLLLGLSSATTSGIELERSSASTDFGLKIKNTANGDAKFTFATAANQFSLGIDNSDSDKFKISSSATDVGTSTLFTLDSSGNITLTGILDLGSNKLTSTYVPTSNEDITNKLYVDTVAASQNELSELTDVTFTSLATGQMMYSTDGANWANASNLYWDETNDRLGIRKTAPSTVLHLAEAGQPTITFEDTVNSSFAEVKAGGTTGSLTLSADSANTKAGSVIAFNVDNSEKVRITADGQVQFLDGTAAIPSVTFTNDTDTGIYRPGTDQLAISTAGVERVKVFASGNTSFSGSILAADGTAAIPSIQFLNDGDTGIYSFGANTIGISAGGVLRATFDTTSLTMQGSSVIRTIGGTAAVPALSFAGDSDTGIYRPTADQLAISTGGVQRLNIYSGFTIHQNILRNPFGTAASPSYTFDGDSTTGIYAPTTSQIAISTGGVTRLLADSSGIAIQNGVLRSTTGTAAAPSITFNSNQDIGFFNLSPTAFAATVDGVETFRMDTSGTLLLNGVFRSTDGSAAAPSITFASDTNTGMYSIGPDIVGISASGTEIVRFSATNGVDLGQNRLRVADGSVGSPGIRFDSDIDTGIYSPGADQLAISTAGVKRFQISSTGIDFSSLKGFNLLDPTNAQDAATKNYVDTASQPIDSDLTALAGLSTTGLITRTGAGTATTRSIVESTTNALTITNGDGVSGNPSIAIQASLDSIAGLTVLPGEFLYTTATNTFARAGITSYIRTLLNDGTPSEARTTLGLNAGQSGDIWVEKAGDTMTGFLTLNADPTSNLHAVTKQYVDAISSGLDPKESVKVATTANLSGYSPTGGTSGNGEFTNIDTTAFDGYSTSNGDRVLVLNQSDAKQNGIYVITTLNATTGTMERATDHDGTPSNEVSGGNTTFVEKGTAYIGRTYVLQGNGTLTLNTDNLVWSLLSNAQDWTWGNGITNSGNTVSAVLEGIGSAGSLGTLSFNGDNIAVDLGFTSTKAMPGNATLANLSNVTESGLDSGEILYYNGTSWTNNNSLQVTAGGQLKLPDGTAAIPSLSFLTDSDTGIFSSGSNNIAFSTAGTQRLRITASGQILTGISGSASAPALSWEGDTNTGIYSPAADQLAISTGGVERLAIDSAGKITLPITGQTLEWSGGGSGIINATGSLSVNIDSDSSSSTGVFQIAKDRTGTTGGTTLFSVSESGQISAGLLGSAAIPAYSFNTDQDTGIYSPGADQLAISTGGVQRLNIYSGFTIHQNILRNPFGTAASPSYAFDGDSATGIYAPTTSQIAISTAGSERMRIDSAGNVGIGKTSPGDLLHVGDAATNSASAIRIEGSTTSSINFADAADDNVGLIQYDHTTNNLTFRTGGSGVDLGISASGQIESYNSGSASSPAWTWDNDTDTGIFRAGINLLGFSTAGVERLRIDSAGIVSLGSDGAFDHDTASTTATTQVSIFEFPAASYTGAKLLVCVTDSTATERHIAEILVTHDGTTAVATQYADVATAADLATFDVDINTGNVRLLATPASTNSMTFKVMSTQLLA